MAAPPQPPQELGYVPLAQVSEDETFRLRQPGEVSSLAQSMAQVGQLFAIEVRESAGVLQPITGFRRLRALRLLHRSRVLVRNHGAIPDEVAALIAAADAIDSRALEAGELREMLERYEAMGWGTPALQELIVRAIERADEHLEDLHSRLRGEAPIDRSVRDEDALEDDDESPILLSKIAPPAESSAPPSQAQAAATSAPTTLPASTAPTPSSAPAVMPAPAMTSAPATAAVSAILAPPPTRARPPADPPLAPLLDSVQVSNTVIKIPPALAQPAMTADELAQDLAERLSEITQDFAVLVDHWAEVPSGLRGILSDQLTYYSRLGSWLSKNTGDLE